MFITTYTAFGLELRRFTKWSFEDVEYALQMICPSVHTISYRPATVSELRLLSSSILIIEPGTVTNSRRSIPRKAFTRKYKSQHYQKKWDYMRDKNIFFFEDEIKSLSYHIPELECLFYVN